MPRALPPMTWFRAFDAAARHLSFTRAADELGFTQSAISQHVRALEDRLGVPLFVRGHRALLLTDAGRQLVPDVAAAMARLHHATERFLPETTRPKLIIAASVSIAQWVLVPQIAQFQTAYPDIAVQIVTTIWPDDFPATNADIEIRFGAEDVVGRDAKLLGPSVLQVVAAPALCARLGDGTDPRALASEVLIQPIGLSTGWAEFGTRIRAPVPLEPRLLVDSHGLAVDLAVAGAGVSLTHGLIARTALSTGRIALLPYDDLAAHEGYYLARKTSAEPQAQAAFLDWFTDMLAQTRS